MNQDHSQLPLFSWQNEVLAEGYQQLAAFNFDEAEFVFLQLREKYVSADPEMEDALVCTRYWKEVFQQLEKTNSANSIAFLHDEISQFRFKKTWGQQRFRSVLIHHLIGLMQRYDVFYVNSLTTLSDLFLQLKEYKKAVQVLSDRVSVAEQDNRLRFRLAQAQWKMKEKRDARRNYALGLLINPASVPLEFLECGETVDLLRSRGPEMAPAYGWVFGILPLVQPPDNISPGNDTHLKALTCYRFLIKAEKASIHDDPDATVEYRKALKESDPEFYKEYFSLISKRRILW